MTLHEFLYVVSRNDYIGIYDMDTRPDQKYKSRDRFQILPTKQSYFKVANIPYGRIGRYLDYKVVGICHTEKGYLVRIMSERHRRNLDNWLLAREIAKEIGYKK